MTDLLKKSIGVSLAAQVSTLFVNLYGLSLPLEAADIVLKEVLGLETIVQIIELIFYIWYSIRVTTKVTDVTHFRYYDWALTTPTMLFSTMLFYEYLSTRGEETQSILKILENKGGKIALVLLLNMGMLIFGYLQEIGLISIWTSTIGGFACFVAFFYLIYRDFASGAPKDQGVYRFMVGIWSLYGIAPFFNDLWKNITYNILDVFAKNFYGVYLSWFIHRLATTSRVDGGDKN
jgi:bacteriorhodopsin